MNTFNGELFFHEPYDLYLGGPMPLYLQRYFASYLARSFVVGDLGDNWRHNFEWGVHWTGNSLKLIDDVGRVTQFTSDGQGNWTQQTNLHMPYQIVQDGTEINLYSPPTDLFYNFSGSGKLAKIEDGKGNTHTLTYSAEGKLDEVTDGLGRSLKFNYTTIGALNKLTTVNEYQDGLPSGRSVWFTYDDTGDTLLQFRDRNSNYTLYEYKDTSGTADRALLTRRTLPKGNTPYSQTYFGTDNQYNSGKVETQTDAYGNTHTFGYTQATMATTMTDPDANARQHVHQSIGALASHTDETGKTINIGTDNTGRRSSIADRLGDTTTQTYDTVSGKLDSVGHADGGNTNYSYSSRIVNGISSRDMTKIDHPDNTSEAATYDSSGNLLTWTEQNGSQWVFTHNSLGQVLTLTNPLGGITTYTYNADGTIASETDDAGNTVFFEYDPVRRLEKITYPDGLFRTFTYDNMDHLLTATDALGNVYTFTYNNNGNFVSTTDPLGNTTLFTYDLMDRIVSVTDALGNSETRTYDKLGRVSATTDRAGNTITFEYDAVGRMTAIIDEENKIWPITYDAEGIVNSMADPLGNTYTFASNKMGITTQFIRPLGGETNIAYDSMGRVIASQNTLGKTRTFEYDAIGQVTKIKLPGGIMAGYTRNAFGQITEIADPDGNVWLTSYDTMGRVTSSTDPLGNITSYNYDNRNRLSHVELPAGTLDFTHDANDNVTRRFYSDGTDLDYTYDALNRLTAADGVSLSYNSNGMLNYSNGLAITRDSDDRISTITLAPGKAVTYTYDNRGLLASVTDWQGGSITFTHNDAGHLLSITRPNGIDSTYSYDANSRISHISHGTIADISLYRDTEGRITSTTQNLPLDPIPEEDTKSFTYDAASQTSTYTYDNLGRLINDGTRSYTWDLASRLTGYTEGGNSISSTYDALGNRLTRTEGGITHSYVWNEALLLPSVSVERQGGSDLRYYVHTPGGSLLYSIDAVDNSRRFYHFDEIGNTLFLTNDTGTVIAGYAYSPYGELIDSTGTLDNPFVWQGKIGVMREGNGLYYMRARYYKSDIGRFISRDLISSINPKKISPYQYAVGNPLGYVDPLGEDAENDAKGAGEEWGKRVGKKLAKDLFKKVLKEKLVDLGLKGPVKAFPLISFVENSAKIYIMLWEVDSALTDLEGQLDVAAFHMERAERAVLSMRKSMKFREVRCKCDLKGDLLHRYTMWAGNELDRINRKIKSLNDQKNATWTGRKQDAQICRDIDRLRKKRDALMATVKCKCKNSEHKKN